MSWELIMPCWCATCDAVFYERTLWIDNDDPDSMDYHTDGDSIERGDLGAICPRCNKPMLEQEDIQHEIDDGIFVCWNEARV